jgi:hypothetical protein
MAMVNTLLLAAQPTSTATGVLIFYVGSTVAHPSALVWLRVLADHPQFLGPEPWRSFNTLLG